MLEIVPLGTSHNLTSVCQLMEAARLELQTVMRHQQRTEPYISSSALPHVSAAMHYNGIRIQYLFTVSCYFLNMYVID